MVCRLLHLRLGTEAHFLCLAVLEGAYLANGIWTAVSGAMAQSERLDTVANNLANMDTPGFKKDIPTFKEYLAHEERDAGAPEIPRGPIKNKELFPLHGRDQTFVINDATISNFKQGNLRVTQNPLDLALDGPGFFEVSTPKGVHYTKHGSFKVSTDGRLVTSQGFPVLAAQPGGLASALPPSSVQPNQGGFSTQGGVGAEPQTTPDVSARYINLSGANAAISIADNGDVYAGDRLVARLGVAEFKDVKELRKEAGLLFKNPKPENQLPEPLETKVKQGLLETSNVNPVEEMTNLIKAHRSYEQNLKAIKAFDEITVKEANDVGKL